MIVAISHAGDDHLAPVLDAVAALGVDAAVVDVSEFPGRASVSLAYGGAAGGWTLRTAAGEVRAEDVEAIWWRRPVPLRADPGLSEADAAFACRQAEEALAGLAASLGVRWVNDPWRDAAASRKPLQLAAAERAGLRVPRTLVTSEPARARAFLEAVPGACVHKALHATAGDWHPTRRIGPDDLSRLDALRLAPVILQEHVAGVDVRVTVAGEALFAAAIDARGTGSPDDFRPAFDAARVERCALPADVERRLRALVAALGLSYAALDLRRGEDGEHWFLEVNPSGQWRFVEERTAQPITAAVARLLAGR